MIDIFTALWFMFIFFIGGWIFGSNYTSRTITPLDDYDPYDPMEYVNRTNHMNDKDSSK